MTRLSRWFVGLGCLGDLGGWLVSVARWFVGLGGSVACWSWSGLGGLGGSLVASCETNIEWLSYTGIEVLHRYLVSAIVAASSSFLYV